ncbi:class I SAM-dependent methyltransferase [Candidatus Neomarinimicrobiota bacterium]
MAIRQVIKAIRHPRWAIAKLAGIIRRKSVPGYCAVCGRTTVLYFAGSNPRETYTCSHCGAWARNRHLAIVLCRQFGLPEPYSLVALLRAHPGLAIYEAQAQGGIHRILKESPGYVASEYLPDVRPGEYSRQGVRCENLEQLSFADHSFDVVITQDVFEHIREPDAAWAEVHRILKPSGYHIFTIPFFPDGMTQRRVQLAGDEDIFVLPQVYHGDGIRDGLVYTDFGPDLLDQLSSMGLPTELHDSAELTDHPHYIRNSTIFVSRKQ